MKLADIVEIFISGDWGEESISEETSNAVYCVRGADIVPIINHDFTNIPKRYICKRSKETKVLQVGDLIIGEVWWQPDTINWSHRICIRRLDKGERKHSLL